MDRSRAPHNAFLFDRGAPTAESFRFLAAPDKPASIDAAAEGKKRKFKGTAYSGDVIEGHWYWDRVVFDLSTTKAPQKLPMLLGHDREKIVGFSESVNIGTDIDVGGMLSGVTDEGKHVAATSDEGFPWQMSVHIEPRSVEEVKAGQTVEVNGRQFTGPINVFRHNTIREISFTPTGWDSQTSAVAMSRGTESNTEKESTMTEAEIKKLQDEKAAAEGQFATEKAAREKAEAEAKVNADKVAKFEADQAKERATKRDAAIKGLFEITGAEFKDETAKPYRDMSDEQFAAVDKQQRELAARANADPSLFHETATRGTGAAQGGTPEQVAEKARELVFAAKAKGQHLDIVDAVKQVRAGAA